jgi:hypothetical protein
MFSAIPMKNPMTFITVIEKSTLKFIWKQKRLRIVQAILSKKSNAGGIIAIAIAIKTARYWHINRHEDQWQNRGRGFETTQLYTPYFLQWCQKYMMEKRQPLQQMLLRKVVICL